MQWRGIPPSKGAGVPFPIPNASTNAQPVPRRVPDPGPKTPGPSLKGRNAPQMPQPHHVFSRVAQGVTVAATVALAPAAALSSNGYSPAQMTGKLAPEGAPTPASPGFAFSAGQTLLNQNQPTTSSLRLPPPKPPKPDSLAPTTGQQYTGRAPTLAANDALLGSAPSLESTPSNQNKAPPSSQRPPAPVIPPKPHNLASITGQQNPGHTPTRAAYNALPVSTPPPGYVPVNRNGPTTPSSQTSMPPPPPLLLQRRNNGYATGGGNTNARRPSHARHFSLLTEGGSSVAPSRSGSSGVSITSPDWASTTVEGSDGDELGQLFETIHISPGQTNGTSTHPSHGLTLPRFERLMEARTPADLSGKVVIPKGGHPIIGGNGVIHIGKFGGRQVAVKMHKDWKLKETKDRPKSDDDLKTEDSNERRIRRELNVWAALKHRNICELLGFADDLHDYRVMISPWYKRGSAANFLKTSPSLDDRIILTRDVCEGLQYLHRFSLVHGDLNPANVLVDDDGVAKLADFGLVRLDQWEGPRGMTTTSPYSGTMRYKPRELFIGAENRWPEATFEADIYSLGCMMVEFIGGVRPFQRFDKKKEIGGAIIDLEPPVLREDANFALGDFADRFWNLLEACWHVDKSRRPNIGTVVKYLDWF